MDGSVVGRDRVVWRRSRGLCDVSSDSIGGDIAIYPTLDNITNAICTVARLESEQLTSNVDRDIVAHCPEQL